MRKVRKSFVICTTIVLLLSGAFVVSGCEYEGKTPGFWKNHEEAWCPSGYSTEMLVGDVFIIPPCLSGLADDTLLEALSYKGGRGVEGAARILLRAAVAAILNSAHPEINYAYTVGEIQDGVNEALASGYRGFMLYIKDFLDHQNNLGAEL